MLYTNELIHETSPYLLQHAHNPVNWYPWGNTALKKARDEDKPVFLSIGYSTCHWCHVMARECFEDKEVAGVLNRYFISIKVDREQRPDIDGVYMRACQSMTGSGGWPLSIFMDSGGNPFFAGTYFPKEAFISILRELAGLWDNNRQSVIENGKRLAACVSKAGGSNIHAGGDSVKEATEMFRESFDAKYGGFGSAPKFPAAHNLMFLMRTAPEMSEITLKQMYLGGIFDHIGGGFSRYSTDRYWLVPHFEKMLYDNALLAMAYLLAYETTGKALYRIVADRIFTYLERDMSCPSGGFYSAQDADSENGEGGFYLFTPDELKRLLGESAGKRFCMRYGITDDGNFEGKNIPNLLSSGVRDEKTEALLEKVYEYRKKRMMLYTDKKILTAWNALVAASYAAAARILKNGEYLRKARETITFVEHDLTGGNTVFAGKTGNQRSGPGFIDDYAFYIFALIQMYRVEFDKKYLDRAAALTNIAIEEFWDKNNGGFFFSGTSNETLIARIKETMDGAMPSGNSVMSYNLSRLSMLTDNSKLEYYAEKQRNFMNGEAAAYLMGYGFYLYSELSVKKIICAVKNPEDIRSLRINSDCVLSIADSPEYPFINGKTTYYVCQDNVCLPPTNML